MKSYTLKATKHPMLYRIVDLDGNWENYAFIKKLATGYNPEKPLLFENIEEAVYLRGVTNILGKGYAKDEFFLNWIADKTTEQRAEILHAASERGDMVHRVIDALLTLDHKAGSAVEFDRETEFHSRETGEERRLTNDEWGYFLAFCAFWAAHAPHVIYSEAPIYNLETGYAGTADAFLVLTKECTVKACPCHGLIGKIGLWDWKTASGIYPSYGPQLASYAHADNLPEYLPGKRANVDYTAILRIGTRHKNGGYEMRVAKRDGLYPDSIGGDWRRFLAAKDIADFDHKPFNPADVIEIPEKVSLMVERYVAPKDDVVADPDAQAHPAEEVVQPTLDGSVPQTEKPKAKAKRKPAAKKAVKKSSKKK